MGRRPEDPLPDAWPIVSAKQGRRPSPHMARRDWRGLNSWSKQEVGKKVTLHAACYFRQLYISSHLYNIQAQEERLITLVRNSNRFISYIWMYNLFDLIFTRYI